MLSWEGGVEKVVQLAHFLDKKCVLQDFHAPAASWLWFISYSNSVLLWKSLQLRFAWHDYLNYGILLSSLAVKLKVRVFYFFFFKSGFLVAITTFWLWAISAALLTSHLELALLDQKNKELREKEALFGWVDLAFFASLVFKWAICTISLALILAAHSTKLQAQLLAHPSIHRLWRTWKKTHPLWNFQTERAYSCCCCWLGLYERSSSAPARPAPKPPTLPNFSFLPTSFPGEAPQCVSTGMSLEKQECPIRN